MSSHSFLLVLVILVCLQCFTMANNNEIVPDEQAKADGDSGKEKLPKMAIGRNLERNQTQRGTHPHLDAHGQRQCCFDYQIDQIPVQLIKAYNKTAHQCTKPGVIFILNKGQQVCADPRVKWVKERMKKIDQHNIKNPTKPKTTV